MRKALNENPIAQLAVVGVLLVVAGFMVMKAMKKDSPPPAPTLGSEGTTVVTDEATGSLSAQTTASVSGTVPVVPGPALPPAVSRAHRTGKVVAVLVVRGGGVDDRLLRASIATLRSNPGVAVFGTRASGVARYARITQGVNLDRVPALVVVRPRRGAGGAAKAEVSYGYRSAESVAQTVRDALYRGPEVGYSPE
jgi:hypothetical protein